jgi:hypothetical protein
MRTRSSSICLPIAVGALTALALALVFTFAWPGAQPAVAAQNYASKQHRTSTRQAATRSSLLRICSARAAGYRGRAHASDVTIKRCMEAFLARGKRTRGKRTSGAHGTARKQTKTTSKVSALPASSPALSAAAVKAEASSPSPAAPSAPAPPVSSAGTGSLPQPTPSSSPGTGTGWDGFGGTSLPGANWRPYASTSPFNQSTEGVAVHPNSAAIVKTVLSWGLPGNLVAGNSGTTEDWSHPTFFAEPSDPIYTLQSTEPWGPNSLNGMRIPIPANARPAGGSDGHMTVVTPDGWEYDFWRAQAPPAGGGTLTFAWGGRTRIDGSGLDSGTGGTAANFGNLAGMIRAPELAAGHIDHALFIVLKCVAQGTSFGYGTTAHAETSSYVYPASAGGAACPAGETNAPPLGARFMLAMSDAQIQALAVPTWKKTILTALAHYGGYVGDTGGPGFAFMFESSTAYTALGLPDPLVQFAQEQALPTWQGDYVFNTASGVEWEKYLRVLVPPSQ